MSRRRSTSISTPSFHQPSWWIVVVGSGLLLVFMVAIVREVIQGHQVRQQVSRLRQEVTVAEQEHRELQDLIDYLSSPTFQEREARLKLGLKKSGERVIVVPGDSNTNQTTAGSTDTTAAAQAGTNPARWWQYFFGPKANSSTSSG